jgi:mannose-6-phosphate isomerase-like protein (cupin superfamily)
MKFSIQNALSFGWEGLKGKAYNSKEDFDNASAAIFEVVGSHGKVKTTKSDRIYYVVEGEGEFSVNGETFKVSTEDVIIIPKNTPYDYKTTSGAMKLFLVHTPAYDQDAEVKL